MNLQLDNLEERQGNTHVIYLVYALSVEVNRLNVLFNLKFHRYINLIISTFLDLQLLLDPLINSYPNFMDACLF